MEVVIVAYGVEYLAMAMHNARTIRRTNPSLTITLVSNMPERWASAVEPEFDRVELRRAEDTANRLAKFDALRVTRADRVLSLDADAEVRGDLAPAFAMLDVHDLLVRPFDLPSKFPHRIGPSLDGQLHPQYWGGMLFFRRNDAVDRLFGRWRDRYVSGGIARDQPALARAILDSPEVRVLR